MTTSLRFPLLLGLMLVLVPDSAVHAKDVGAVKSDAGIVALLEPIRAKASMTAMGGAVVTSRGLVAQGVTGVRALGSKVPVTTADRWHIGSCTKAMTATARPRRATARRGRSSSGT